MKKLLLTFTILFSTLMISTPSYGEWTEVSENKSGDTFYVDFERIRKHDGYVYYWKLADFLKPLVGGYLSMKMYYQGDCKVFRQKSLSYSFHKEPMGGGTGENLPIPETHKGWKYPPPTSADEVVLKQVCSKQ